MIRWQLYDGTDFLDDEITDDPERDIFGLKLAIAMREESILNILWNHEKQIWREEHA